MGRLRRHNHRARSGRESIRSVISFPSEPLSSVLMIDTSAFASRRLALVAAFTKTGRGGKEFEPQDLMGHHFFVRAVQVVVANVSFPR